jgi:hypothetical protein
LTALFVVPKYGRAHSWLAPVMLALTLPILLTVKAVEQAGAQSWEASSESVPEAAKSAESGAPSAVPTPVAIPAGVEKAAFHWLGDFDSKSPILVVSFQCSHCLDLLEEVVSHPRLGTLKGPKLFVYAAHGTSGDTIAVLAAILSVPGTPEEQFATVFAEQDSFRDALITHDSEELRNRLNALFPAYTSKLEAAKQIYTVQTVALKYISGRGSPYMVFPDGTSKFGGDVTPDLLFH